MQESCNKKGGPERASARHAAAAKSQVRNRALATCPGGGQALVRPPGRAVPVAKADKNMEGARTYVDGDAEGPEPAAVWSDGTVAWSCRQAEATRASTGRHGAPPAGHARAVQGGAEGRSTSRSAAKRRATRGLERSAHKAGRRAGGARSAAHGQKRG